MTDRKTPGDSGPETNAEKTERLKAVRLQAERDKDARIARATRKTKARRKVLGES